MTQGRMIAVVGPSGVGKDSVMVGIKAAAPEVYLVQRVITRGPDLGGEDYHPVSGNEFDAMVRDGAFAVHWQAHGLSYGIPVSVKDVLIRGVDCLANFSRSALSAGADAFDNFLVMNITARRETLAQRLANRGRERSADIDRRLAQADKPIPAGLQTVTISNDGPLDETVACALAAVQPVKV